MSRPRRLPHAFTLIELLVVISIISLLIALLLPALRSARVAAYMSQSLSNLRQINIATHGYAADEKGSIPYANYRLNSGGAGVPPTWAGALRSGTYVGTAKLFWSPGRDISAIAAAMPTMETAYFGTNVNGFNVHEAWSSTGYGCNTYAMPLFNENRAPLNLGLADTPPHSSFVIYTETWQRGRIAGYYINSGDYRDLNGTSRVFTINGGAARAYLDGHATGSAPTEIGWQATDPYNGKWLYVSIGALDAAPWYRNWEN